MYNFIHPIYYLQEVFFASTQDYLDGWLMVDENMVFWEDKMTSYQRVFLIRNFVSEYLVNLMAKELYVLIVIGFESNGCIIDMLENYEYDDKLRPQGISVEK